jgi:hypothetical protein
MHDVKAERLEKQVTKLKPPQHGHPHATRARPELLSVLWLGLYTGDRQGPAFDDAGPPPLLELKQCW